MFEVLSIHLKYKETCLVRTRVIESTGTTIEDKHDCLLPVGKIDRLTRNENHGFGNRWLISVLPGRSLMTSIRWLCSTQQ